ncbi:MAG: hypothetical protein ABIZ80_16415 [Bryobacteraceae bacterium]
MIRNYAALFGAFCLAAPAAQVNIIVQSPEQLAQQGATISAAVADQLEAQLAQQPFDMPARAKLLGYYYYQWMRPGEAAARAARRRHILWVIQNQPDSPLAGLMEAAIVPDGSSLADPEGFQQARQLWMLQMDAKKGNPQVLGNLAQFVMLTDKDLAESALKRAVEIDPRNAQWNWSLGYLYAMGTLGVDALGLNGQPTSVDPFARMGPFAVKARKALDASNNPLLLAVAASILSRYGTMLAPSEKAKMDYIEESIKLARKSQILEPNNPSWLNFLKQLEGWKRQLLAPGALK